MSDSPELPIRVGIVGLGRSGHDIHCHTLDRAEGFEVVAVADTDTNRAAEVGSSRGIRWHDGIDALLRDDAVELVVVATPNRFHAEHAIRALRSGHHVVCEKPFGITVEEVDAMIAARGDRVLAPFQNRRYEQAYLKVKEVVGSGVLGRVVHVRTCWHGHGRRWDWQTLRSEAGGQLNNNLPHAIDQMLSLWEDAGWDGTPEPEVWSDLRRILALGDAEDHVRLTLRVPGRPELPTIDIEFTAAAPMAQETWNVMASCGGLSATPARVRWKWTDPTTWPARTLDKRSTPDRSYNRDIVEWHEESLECTQTIVDAQLALYAEIRSAIRTGAPLTVTPEIVRRRIRVMELARRNAP
ncbi:MAG: Gfo/Idh/MocA family oxidoreductase [Armatimonadota bacterium]